MKSFDNIAIIGMGLMGASLAAALKKAGFKGGIHGYARKVKTAEQGVEKGWFDQASSDLKKTVSHADLIVLALPVCAMESLFEQMQPHLKTDAIVTDVGSTKQQLVASLGALSESKTHWFVGSHPICGSEKSGLDAAHEALYEGHACIICPTPDTPSFILASVRELWASVGMQLWEMPAAEHDALLATTSHLPHIMATALVRTVAGQTHTDVASFCGSGFEDTTRIASGSAEVWSDILWSNRHAIEREIIRIQQELSEISGYIAQQDREKMYDWLQKGVAQRASLIDQQGAL